MAGAGAGIRAALLHAHQQFYEAGRLHQPRTELGVRLLQIFYKLRHTGETFRFPGYEAFSIVDLRDIGVKYEWVVLKVNIFNFGFRIRPLGQDAPEVVANLNEESGSQAKIFEEAARRIAWNELRQGMCSRTQIPPSGLSISLAR
jgi:hypothetical protein